MADQVQNVTDGAQEHVQGISEKAESYTSGALSTLDSWASQITGWAKGILDRFFPPEQRAAILAKIQEFMLANPKLSTFLGMNIALTGIPLGLFICFGLAVAVFALIVGLVLGLLAAVLFTLFCLGIALSVVFPIIFFTTMTACFLFLWGLGGYYLLKWLNGTSDTDGSEAKPILSSGSIGDSLNSLTGGRLTGFMDSAKAERAKGDISGFGDEYTKPKPPAEKEKSTEKQQPKQQQSVGHAISAPAPSVQKAAKATGVDSKVKTTTNATSVVKGGLSGTTGLG